MVPVTILTLIASSAPAPSIIVLQPQEKQVRPGRERIVPIWIGTVEAINLGMALESQRYERPSTHDLFLDAVTSLDATVDHVFIDRVKDKTFFAKLVLSQHGRLIQLDARPSDALALAVRQQAPLYIDEHVLDTASYPYIYKEPFDEEQAVSDFHDFLEHITPDDFRDE